MLASAPAPDLSALATSCVPSPRPGHCTTLPPTTRRVRKRPSRDDQALPGTDSITSRIFRARACARTAAEPSPASQGSPSWPIPARPRRRAPGSPPSGTSRRPASTCSTSRDESSASTAPCGDALFCGVGDRPGSRTSARHRRAPRRRHLEQLPADTSRAGSLTRPAPARAEPRCALGLPRIRQPESDNADMPRRYAVHRACRAPRNRRVRPRRRRSAWRSSPATGATPPSIGVQPPLVARRAGNRRERRHRRTPPLDADPARALDATRTRRDADPHGGRRPSSAPSTGSCGRTDGFGRRRDWRKRTRSRSPPTSKSPPWRTSHESSTRTVAPTSATPRRRRRAA